MAKKTGLAGQFYVGGYDLSNDIGQLDNVTLERNLLEVTGLDRSAVERLGGLYTSSIGFTGFFNPAALKEHVVLSSLPTVDTQIQYHQSSTLGARAAGMVGRQVNYAWTRGADGALGIQVEAQSNDDFLNWGQSLTSGQENDTTATSGTGVNMLDATGTDTAFGMVAYSQVFTFTGTSCTLTIEESNDDASGDAYAAVTGGAFAAASGITHERIQTSLSQTVEDWLRLVSSGTFSDCTFACVAKRYDTANAER